MSDIKLGDFLCSRERAEYATGSVTSMNERLEQISVAADGTLYGDADIIARIGATPELKPFFAPGSRAEVPVAGTIFNRFVSRRIDRMMGDDANKTVWILDYKTDIDPTVMREKYVSQIREYVNLMQHIYPTYTVNGYILWTHDWRVEKII